MAGPAGGSDQPQPDSQALYDEAACGLLLTSADGTIQRVNRTFCRWLGRDAAALVGRARFQDLLTMGGRIFHQTHLAPLLQIQGSVAEVKLDLVHADGRSIPVVVNTVRRQHTGAWQLEFAVFVAEDRHQYERELLIARKKAEESLVQEQRSRQALADAQAERDQQRAVAEDRALFAEQMMGIVSHDLRNPLSVIRMSAHLIGMGELSSNQMRALGRITSSTMRAGRMIADLLDFTQARLGGGLKLTTASVDVQAAVAESVEDLKLAFAGRQLIHIRRGEGLCEASSDRVVQMVGNLVANAMTYGALDQPVTVTSVVAPGAFEISVHNHGQPIPAELVPTLFMPMSRGDGAAEAGHSVGLGLFIVREIVQAHGGSVTVTSDEAQGTTFRASFPRRIEA